MTTTPLERRGAKRALWPLALLALTFLVPSFRACSDQPAQSPAQYALGDVGAFAWIAPVFLGAAALGWLTWRALRRREVDLTTRRLGLVIVGGVALSSLVGALLQVWPITAWAWLLVVAGVLGAAVAVVRRARGRPPFGIWEHLLAAFSLTSLIAAPTMVFSGELLFGNPRLLGPGAFLYLGALAALLTVTLSALLRRAPVSSP